MPIRCLRWPACLPRLRADSVARRWQLGIPSRRRSLELGRTGSCVSRRKSALGLNAQRARLVNPRCLRQHMPSVGRAAPPKVEQSPCRGNGGNHCRPHQRLGQPHAPLHFDDPPLRTPQSRELVHGPRMPAGGQGETRSRASRRDAGHPAELIGRPVGVVHDARSVHSRALSRHQAPYAASARRAVDRHFRCVPAAAPPIRAKCVLGRTEPPSWC